MLRIIFAIKLEVCSMVDAQKQLPILKRVGAVLLVVGFFDIGVMIYCIMNEISYASSFNIFAVWLGILLKRGSLWAASIVRSFSAFFFGSSIGLIAVFPFLQPIGPTLAEIRHAPPLTVALFVALVLFLQALLFWTARELNREPVLAAFRASGDKVRPLVILVVLGIGLVAVISGIEVFT